MDRPAPEAGRGRRHARAASVRARPATLATLLLTAVCACFAQASTAEEGRSYLARARELASRARYDEALGVLREARIQYASSDLLPEVLLLSARISIERGDEFRARYFLSEVLRMAPQSAAAAEAGEALGDMLLGDRLYAEALDAYRIGATAAAGRAMTGSQGLYFRMAEIAALYLDDRPLAWEYLGHVDPLRLESDKRELYAMILSRARWEVRPTSSFGLEDPNVSVLAADADDLWIGTWSGGLARCSRSSGAASVFREGESSLVANTVRAICITTRHVWVGTDQGLSQYSKALSAWRNVEPFGGKKPKKVQAIREVEGRLYVATLGDGLWELEGEAWQRIGEREMPTAYTTSLGETGRWILVGTMDHGLLLLPRDGGSVAEAEAVAPGLTPRNITALHADARGTVWVASYGEGLWEWDPASGTVAHHSAAGGRIGDDWVMCVAESSRGVYFGTFGGGVAFRSIDGTWSRFGLAEGLAGMDVMSALAVRSVLYFGTLGSGVSVYHEGLD